MYACDVPVRSKRLRRQSVELGGLERTRRCTEGALSDSMGLSSEQWPCLSQRRGRAVVRTAETCSELFGWDKLVSVEGTQLCYDGRAVGTVTPGRKQFAVVGDKLCIFPDKKYLDLSATPKVCADLGARVEGVAGSAQFTPGSLDLNNSGAALGIYRAVSRAVPSQSTYWTFREEDAVWDAEHGWGDIPFTLVKGNKLHELAPGTCLMLPACEVRGDRYPAFFTSGDGSGAAFDAWGDYAYLRQTVYWEDGGNNRPSQTILDLERRNVGRHNPEFADLGFRVGDTVRISGCTAFPDNDLEATVAAIDGTRLLFDPPVFAACVDTPGPDGQMTSTPQDCWNETGVITVERPIPDLDFVCACGNRLFGVCNADRTVYASALGDPTNFIAYGAGRAGSWRGTPGTDGDFTGCVAYGSGALFWKGDCLHRLAGTHPDSFELFTSQIPGLQAGCEGSMVILGDVLYYKSRDGVYAYAGSAPKKVSQALGDLPCRFAAAGGDSRGYHISLADEAGGWEFLSYDTEKKLWLREDDLACERFACLGGTLYALSRGRILALDRGWDDEGVPIAWEAVFTPFTEGVPERKYPSRLLLRLELAPGSWAEAWLARDDGPFRLLWSGHDAAAPTALIPIRPGRCDSYRLRLRGEGRCVIGSLCREFTLGGVR